MKNQPKKTRDSYRLNEALCHKLEAPAKGNRLYFDSVFPGLALRVTAAGSRSWVFCYRMNGKEYRMTLERGKFPAMSPAVARKKAKIESAKVDQGRNPLKERQGRRDAHTLKSWSEIYIRDHAKPHKKASSVQVDELSIRYLTDYFGKNKKFKDITRADIKRFHNSFLEKRNAQGEPQTRTANKTLATLSHMYSCAIADEIDGIDANLVVGIQRFPENSRDRYLHGEELERFVNALSTYTEETKAQYVLEKETRPKNKQVRILTELRLIQFLLLTGARIGETTNAKWEEIDFERGIWVKPSHHTKAKKKEHVPLNSAALELLRQWEKEPKRSKSDLIFPGSIPDKGIAYPRKTFKELKKRAEVSDFNPHDLRHTFASQLVMSGKSLTIVGKLIGHTQQATTLRYAHLADDPLREASDIMGNLIGGMAKGRKAEVSDIRKRGAK